MHPREVLVIRSDQVTGYDDGSTGGIDSQQHQVEQRVNIRTEQYAVSHIVGFRPAVGEEVCCLEHMKHVAAGYGAAAGVGVQQGCPERCLAAPSGNLAEHAEPRVVIVSGQRAFFGIAFF